MKDVQKLFEKGLEIINDLGIEFSHPIKEVTVNTRALNRWGRCSYNRESETYTIQISNRILRDEIPEDATMSVMLHELLHCTKAKGHNWRWKMYAGDIMNAYPQYTITRTLPSSFFGLQEEQKELTKKYVCECEKCGKQLSRAKMSPFIKHPEIYIHKNCGGYFTRVI